MKEPHLQLSEAERADLQSLVRQHKVGVKAHRRATALLALDAGQSLKEAGQTAGGADYNAVARWRERCKEEGALAALHDRARSGRRPRIDGTQRATSTALACSQPPAGHARGSLRLLAGKLVELGHVEAISHDHVGTILKKTRFQPHRQKTWWLGELNGRFLAAMKRLRWRYGLPHEPTYPVLCFDERAGFLIGQSLAALEMRAGQPAREHYAYVKKGSCCLWAAIAPKSGARLAQVHPRRTKREAALCLEALAARSPHAPKIRLVQDNLNTLDPSALDETFAPAQACALAQRCECFFPPKGASWLNMIEIEFCALARQCLHRRIASFETLEREVLALVEERAAKALKIDWQFSIATARDTFARHYRQIREEPALCYDI